eukprot:1816675-Pyramimonas_sp.AAC.1
MVSRLRKGWHSPSNHIGIRAGSSRERRATPIAGAETWARISARAQRVPGGAMWRLTGSILYLVAKWCS